MGSQRANHRSNNRTRDTRRRGQDRRYDLPLSRNYYESLKFGGTKVKRKFIFFFFSLDPWIEHDTSMRGKLLNGLATWWPGYFSWGNACYTWFQGIASSACLKFGIGQWDEATEDEVSSKRFSLQDDISRTGNRIAMNRKTFWRVKFHASNDLSLVNRKSLFLELWRFKVFLILMVIKINDWKSTFL